MKNNNSKDINDAVLGGILVFCVIFLSMKDLFSVENQGVFKALILVYAFAPICKIFGLILESDKINDICIHYCKLVLLPFTVWAIVGILFTEIKLTSDFAFLLTHYSFLYSEYLILTKTYGIKFRSPITFGEKETKKKD